MLKLCAALIVLLVVAGTAVAQNYQGTGDNRGSGWRSDGSGGLIGTGDKRGSGWRSDGSGGLIGTGDKRGSG